MNPQPKIDPFAKKQLAAPKQQEIVVGNKDEVFTTLEELFLQNAEAAAKAFSKNMHLLNAEQLAKCATMFAGKGLEIKMAREKGFKDTPIKTEVLIMLKETLDKVTPAKVIDVT